MKKIFNLLAGVSLVATGSSNVIACTVNCSHNKPTPNFDPFNLSTWGETQKTIIRNEYIKEWKSSYEDPNVTFAKRWITWYNSSLNAINTALYLINRQLIITNPFSNVTYSYYPNPSGDTKQTFEQGINLYVVAYNNPETPSPFKGELEVNLKL